jgi:uncharacterized membrane protein YjfL (UPF0719 family)
MRENGAQAALEDPAVVHPLVDADAALATSGQQAGFLNKSKVASISLVSLTRLHDPDVQDRLVWLTVYHGVKIPALGPNAETDDIANNGPSTAGMWVAIDARSGDFVVAQSI